MFTIPSLRIPEQLDYVNNMASLVAVFNLQSAVKNYANLSLMTLSQFNPLMTEWEFDSIIE